MNPFFFYASLLLVTSSAALAKGPGYVTYVNYAPSADDRGSDGHSTIRVTKSDGDLSGMGFSMEKTNYCDEKAVHKCVKIGGLVLSVPRDRLAVGDEWTEVSSKKEVTRSLEWIDVETRIKYRVLSEGAFCVLGKSIPIFTIQGTYSDGKSMQYLYSTSLGVVAIFFPENVDDDVPRFFVLVDEKGLLWEE